eukprot:gene20372-27141_t
MAMHQQRAGMIVSSSSSVRGASCIARAPLRPRSARYVVSKATPSDPTFNFNLALDKAHETKMLAEIIALPPSALQGLTEKSDQVLEGIKLRTIKDLALLSRS